ncbi:choline kinase [Vibrio sp. 16]|uniref:phosphotransferase family protein n=1 Tax=Vibrio sp. 16 TaxID=391586 RepID=UPI002FF06D1C
MSNQDLSRMGAARVSIEMIDGVECIRKRGASEVEINLYQTAAPHLTGVNIPTLVKLDEKDLYIERVPNPISLTALRSKPKELFSQLASLHHSNYSPPFPVKTHQWTTEATEDALNVLRLPEYHASKVIEIQQLSSCLFQQPNLISGDTNDGNWGTRANGDLVLFDWERFGKGSPAIDLAPLVAGLGTLEDYREIIRQYTQYSTLLTKQELERHLVIAKCWIIIEVVNILVSRDNSDKEKYITWYRNHIPDWLDRVSHVL